MSDLRVDEASAADAVAMCAVIHEAFGARRRLTPPSTALAETAGSVAAAIARAGGLVCRVDGIPAGALLFVDERPALRLRRVSVTPRFQSRGVATAMVGVAEEVAAGRDLDDVRVYARAELPATVTFWQRRGYVDVAHSGQTVTLAKALPVELVAATADDSRAVGRRLACVVRRGDVVLLTGELGAGKTTLAQGLGAGLRVRGDVTSPTFVISRVHPPLTSGPGLVHVDAYRLGDKADLDDVDVDALVDDSVTVVEWGDDIAEALSDHRLKVHLGRAVGDETADDARVVTVTPVGARWVGARVRSTLLGALAQPTSRGAC